MLRVGYFREIFGGDDDGEGGADEWPEAARDSRLGLYRTLEDLLERTHWDDRLPDSLTTRQYRGAVVTAAGSGSLSMTSLDKEALTAVADHLGADAPDGATNEDLREAIADAAGFEYERGTGSRAFDKSQLKTLAAVAVKRRWLKEKRS